MMRPLRTAVAASFLMTAAIACADPDFTAADRAIETGLTRGDAPGAVLLVGKGNAIVYERAYGNRSLKPTTQPMTADTIFDLASITKPLATATSVLILADRGKIDLSAPIATYIPELANRGKEAITIEMLLLHHGGLIADNPMADYVGTPQQMIERIFVSTPKETPGTTFIYSDVGFILLGELVRRVDGRPVDRFAQEEIFAPLEMTDTGYTPPAPLRDRIAPTEQRKGEWIVGTVHDPRAFALGGVAGHAGTFGTARDLSRWIQMLNNGGALRGKRILSEAIVNRMLTPQPLPDGTGARGLGVDIDSSFASCRGSRFDRGTTFGHTGWTGTMFWSDPVNDVYVVLFTNRVHPDGKGDVKRMRSEVATAVAEALLGPATK